MKILKSLTMLLKKPKKKVVIRRKADSPFFPYQEDPKDLQWRVRNIYIYPF